MISHLICIFILIVFAVSCGNNVNKNKSNISNQKDTSQQIVNANTNKADIIERGVVKQIEDSGYPFATVTIEFPERTFSESFIINIENVKNASLSVINT